MTTVKDYTQEDITAADEHMARPKAKLQKVISDTTEEMLESLLDILVELDFEIVKPPTPGLLMLNIRESDGTVFHLGEVLVTQAEVQRDDRIGFGLSLGDRPDAAMVMACLDIVDHCEISADAKNRMTKEIDQIYRQVYRQRNSSSQMAALTRVDFHSMAKE